MATTSPRDRARRAAFLLKIAATRQQLVERFPACFAPKGAEKRPLALGVTRDIIAACTDLTATDIRRAVRDYASGPTYLRNMRVGATRVGLDGQPCGGVDHGGALLAAGQLRAVEARIAAHAKRKAARSAEQAPEHQTEAA